MTKPCSPKEICTTINGELIEQGTLSLKINHLCTDSRKILVPEESCFFAIIGENRDGHGFITEAYRKGVRCFVISEKTAELNSLNNSVFIVVNNSLKALQLLAQKHRESFTFPIISITGSNGKTVVKEWLYQLLREEKNIVRSPNSYNSQIGVPLSIWLCEKQNNLGIFEAGISMPGEMDKLEKIIQPSIGIFTNLGSAHEQNFLNPTQKTQEKLKLFKSVDTLIYNKDNEIISTEIAKNKHWNKNNTFTWSKKETANLQVLTINKSENSSKIQLLFEGDLKHLNLPFKDNASIENAITCCCALLVLKYNFEFIQEQITQLEPVAMRLELRQGGYNCSIVNDYYNSDLNSLEIALDFIAQQKQHAKKTVVLSDIYQSKKPDKELYQTVNQLLYLKEIKKLIGIGPNITNHQKCFDLPCEFFNSTEDFLANYKEGDFANESILLKGARRFKFERIANLLEKQSHGTVLEINLSAMQHNLNFFKSKVQSDTKIMVMVKALSYGSGSFEVANLLQFNRVDYLGVAYVDEGVTLRKAGIKTPIIVMNPEAQAYDLMIKYQLEPEIYNFKTLHLFAESIKNSSKEINQYPIHLKFDTGMHRLGFEEQDIPDIYQFLLLNLHLKIKSVFSHLATSDEPKMQKHTLKQIECFKKIRQFFLKNYSDSILFHILNSAGILVFPEAQFDMVRLGIGLYGVAPFPEYSNKLEQVSELKTRISQIKNLKKGDAIGYGRKEIATKPMKIATIPIGYADGLRRSLGNRIGCMHINNQQADIVGNVCMDMCMLDITKIDAKEGDEVIVFGKKQTVLDFAEKMGTISYEALTTISPRVKRIYYQD